jgi:hypothetical protein
MASEYTVFRHRKKKPYYEGEKVLEGRKFKVQISWNSSRQVWYMNLSLIINPEEFTINGKALLMGKELLEPYGYKHILPGELWVVDVGGIGTDPTYEGFGDLWELRYYPNGR